jgi:wobble nucleotide-excising tRNase
MSDEPVQFKNIEDIADHFREQLKTKQVVLLYAYNGTGKTRLSMAFKDAGKTEDAADTLYFNAYTEDLFFWDNDLEGDTERKLKINASSHFFSGFRELSLEDRIRNYFDRYTDVDFKIDYDNWFVHFSQGNSDFIKISRGEENIFIWCVFLAICKLVFDGNEAYSWVKYIYIDDPISSLDDNNAIAVASDLSGVLKENRDRARVIISSHHALFFNVLYNELGRSKCSYFLSHTREADTYHLNDTADTPFFYHVAMLQELVKAERSGKLYTYHFNILRGLLEKTAQFLGYTKFSDCILKDDYDPDGIVYARIINILSHGNYSLYEPKEMIAENKEYFGKLLRDFITQYHFKVPELTAQQQGDTTI